MPNWVVSILSKNLNKAKFRNKTKVLVLGVTYKNNINDTRSPGLKIIDILLKKNFSVSYSDPFVSSLGKYRDYNFSKMKSVKLNKNNLKKFSAVVLVTDHDKFNKKLILENANLVIDTKKFFKENNQKIIKA